MRVLHLNDKVSLAGGVETYIQQLVELLPPYGVTPTWMGVSTAGRGQYRVAHYSDKESRQQRSWDDFATYFTNFMDSQRVDVIHMHSISDRRLIEFCLDARPVVRSMHEPRMFCPGQGKFWRLDEKPCTVAFGPHCIAHAYTKGCTNRHPKRLIDAYRTTQYEIKHASRAYGKVLVMSEFMKQEAVESGISEASIDVNPYFTEPVTEPSVVGSGDPVHLLFVGRLIESKGIHTMLEAVRPILKGNGAVRLTIAGDGTMYPQLEAQVAALASDAVDAQVSFKGWLDRDAVGHAIDQSDILVVPSIYPEAFGIVGIEAMMRSRPVVAFDVGGISSWLQHEKTGLLVEPGNRVALSRALTRLIDDEALRRQFGEQGRAVALARFVPEIHLARLTATYQSCIT